MSDICLEIKLFVPSTYYLEGGNYVRRAGNRVITNDAVKYLVNFHEISRPLARAERLLHGGEIEETGIIYGHS